MCQSRVSSFGIPAANQAATRSKGATSTVIAATIIAPRGPARSITAGQSM